MVAQDISAWIQDTNSYAPAVDHYFCTFVINHFVFLDIYIYLYILMCIDILYLIHYTKYVYIKIKLSHNLERKDSRFFKKK